MISYIKTWERSWKNLALIWKLEYHKSEIRTIYWIKKTKKAKTLFKINIQWILLKIKNSHISFFVKRNHSTQLFLQVWKQSTSKLWQSVTIKNFEYTKGITELRLILICCLKNNIQIFWPKLIKLVNIYMRLDSQNSC